MSGFTKLFSTITESSLWSESKDVRILWVAMLAKADAHGVVEAAVPGLARMANLTLDETKAALDVLMAPDPYSKNPENDGRRVEQCRDGFVILNYGTYRHKRDDEQRREYMREYMRNRRNADPVNNSVNNVNSCKLLLAEVSHSKPQLAQAEAEAEAEADKDVGDKQAAGAASTSKKAPVDDSDFLAELQSMPAYIDIDVAHELNKMQSWCLVNHKQPTRRRFINWLNRVEKPMQVQAVATSATPKPASVWTLKQQLEALEQEKREIEQKHGMETPHGLQWMLDIGEDIKTRYRAIMQQRKQVRAQIAAGGGA